MEDLEDLEGLEELFRIMKMMTDAQANDITMPTSEAMDRIHDIQKQLKEIFKKDFVIRLFRRFNSAGIKAKIHGLVLDKSKLDGIRNLFPGCSTFSVTYDGISSFIVAVTIENVFE